MARETSRSITADKQVLVKLATPKTAIKDKLALSVLDSCFFAAYPTAENSASLQP